MIQYSVYFNELLNFLRTVTIKNTRFADGHRRKEARKRHIDDSALSEFLNPYYLNMCGIYTENDTIMVSGDQAITVEYFDEQIYQRARYAVSSNSYNFLCRNYPNQVDLLKSILYPPPVSDAEVDAFIDNYIDDENNIRITGVSDLSIFADTDLLDRVTIPVNLNELKRPEEDEPSPRQLQTRATRLYKVITASDYSMVSYDDTILETWERTSMVSALHEYLKYYSTRWRILEFERLEQLYGATAWTIFWYQLILVLHAQRVKNIRTSSVHSYHIWEYLRSNGLGNFSKLIDRNQQYYLYRNFRYLLNNKGKTSTFNELTDNILVPNAIQVFGKYMLSDTSTTLTDLVRLPQFVSTGIGRYERQLQHRQLKYEQLDTILSRENKSQLEPIDDFPYLNEEQRDILQNIPNTAYRTKLIEFSRLPRYASYEDFYASFYLSTLFHEWYTGRLDDITVDFYVSYYQESLTLSITDFIYLMIYVAFKLSGSTDDINEIAIPETFNCDLVLRSSRNGNKTINGIPAGTTIESVDSGTQVTLTNDIVDTIANGTTMTIGDNTYIVDGEHIVVVGSVLTLVDTTGIEVGDVVKAESTITASYTNNSSILTSTSDLSNIQRGMSISGTDIPVGSIVLAVDDTTIRSSRRCTATGNDETVIIGDMSDINADAVDEVFTWFTENATGAVVPMPLRRSENSRAVELKDALLTQLDPSLYNSTKTPLLGYKFQDITSFSDELERRFGIIIDLILKLRGSSSSYTGAMTTSVLYDHCLIRPTFEKAALFSTFGNWRTGYPPINGLLELHENSDGSDENITWINLMDQITKRGLPILTSKWMAKDLFSSSEYNQMVEFIIKLCSYNVAFLDQRKYNTMKWLKTVSINHRGLGRQYDGKTRVPMEPVMITAFPTPSSMETRVISISGTIEDNGPNKITLGGLSSKSRCNVHPADIDGTFSLDLFEVMNFIDAHDNPDSTSFACRMDPHLITDDDIVRAIDIYTSGGPYSYDPTLPSPECWIIP